MYQSFKEEKYRSRIEKWSSGNENVDKVIRNAQLSAKNSKCVLEWIPYNKFKDVKYMAKGGFGTVYFGYWVDGQILEWNKEFSQWRRHGKNIVAFKRLHNSQFITMEFLDQVCIYFSYITLFLVQMIKLFIFFFSS